MSDVDRALCRSQDTKYRSATFTKQGDGRFFNVHIDPRLKSPPKLHPLSFRFQFIPQKNIAGTDEDNVTEKPLKTRLVPSRGITNHIVAPGRREKPDDLARVPLPVSLTAPIHKNRVVTCRRDIRVVCPVSVVVPLKVCVVRYPLRRVPFAEVDRQRFSLNCEKEAVQIKVTERFFVSPSLQNEQHITFRIPARPQNSDVNPSEQPTTLEVIWSFFRNGWVVPEERVQFPGSQLGETFVKPLGVRISKFRSDLGEGKRVKPRGECIGECIAVRKIGG